MCVIVSVCVRECVRVREYVCECVRVCVCVCVCVTLSVGGASRARVFEQLLVDAVCVCIMFAFQELGSMCVRVCV